ncbi:MAG: PAS domain S-box protein [Mariprofundus sp.]|nr:PAS domain S-box protein [Mariprofundus sp.]
MFQRYGLFFLGCAAAVIYWPLEALLHFFVFDHDDLLRDLFSHDLDELWMRAVISLLFILFGWYAQRSLNVQHQLQERLIYKRDRLSQIIDLTYDAYVAIDDEGTVIGWNRSAEQMFGWQRQDAIGQDMAELLVPERFRTFHRAGMQRYIQSGIATMMYKPVTVWAVNRAHVEFEISMVVTPLRAGDRQEFFAFIQKVTTDADS